MTYTRKRSGFRRWMPVGAMSLLLYACLSVLLASAPAIAASTPIHSPAVNKLLAEKVMPSGSRLYWQLQGEISTGHVVNVYGIDMEDNEHSGLIQTLQSNGKLVSCYFSAGSYEDWRSDAKEFDKQSDIGNPLGDWAGEYYLDVRSESVRSIMRTRMDRAAAAGCDAVEPDNTDAYQANNGLDISAAQQMDYLLFLARYAHSKDLMIGLKNSVDLIADGDLADVFDFTLNESCYAFDECDSLKPFINAGKAVFIAMYDSNNVSARCADAKANGFDLAFYGSDHALDGSVFSICP